MADIEKPLRQLRLAVRKIEAEAQLLEGLRDYAKSESGRLTPFGKNFVAICVEAQIPQSEIAKILGVTGSAISQNVAKMKEL